MRAPVDRDADVRRDPGQRRCPRIIRGNLRFCLRSSASRGQAFAEYAILLVIVSAALLGMQVFARRGLQAGIKMSADALSPHANDTDGKQAQRDGIRYESKDRQNKAVASGTVLTMMSRTRALGDQEIRTARALDGSVTKTTIRDTSVTNGDLPGNLADRSEVVVTESQAPSILPPPPAPALPSLSGPPSSGKSNSPNPVGPPAPSPFSDFPPLQGSGN